MGKQFLLAAAAYLVITCTASAQITFYNMHSTAANTATGYGANTVVNFAADTTTTPNSASVPNTNVTTPVQHTLSTTYAGSQVNAIVSNYLGSLYNPSGSSGSGTYTRVFATQAPGNRAYAAGINNLIQYNPNKPAENKPPTTQNLIYDSKSGGVALPLINVGLVNVVNAENADTNAVGQYFEFLIDINETGNAVSLDEMIIWQLPANDQYALNPQSGEWEVTARDPSVPYDVQSWKTFQANHSVNNGGSDKQAIPQANNYYTDLVNQIEGSNAGKILWSLDNLNVTGSAGSRTVNSYTDNSILFNEPGSGSGSGDYNVLIPTSVVAALDGNPLNDRFMFWVKWGSSALLLDSNGNILDFGDAGGFKEIAYKRSGGTNLAVPEPGTFVSGLALISLIILNSRGSEHRRKNHKQG